MNRLYEPDIREVMRAILPARTTSPSLLMAMRVFLDELDQGRVVDGARIGHVMTGDLSRAIRAFVPTRKCSVADESRLGGYAKRGFDQLEWPISIAAYRLGWTVSAPATWEWRTARAPAGLKQISVKPVPIQTKTHKQTKEQAEAEMAAKGAVRPNKKA